MKTNLRNLLVLFAAVAAVLSGIFLADSVGAEQPKEIVIHTVGDITGHMRPVPVPRLFMDIRILRNTSINRAVLKGQR